MLFNAEHIHVPASAKIAFTSEDRVRDVIHNLNRDGFRRAAPKYSGGRPLKTWKESNDPDFEAKKNRMLQLYDLADAKSPRPS